MRIVNFFQIKCLKQIITYGWYGHHFVVCLLGYSPQNLEEIIARKPMTILISPARSPSLSGATSLQKSRFSLHIVLQCLLQIELGECWLFSWLSVRLSIIHLRRKPRSLCYISFIKSEHSQLAPLYQRVH